MIMYNYFTEDSTGEQFPYTRREATSKVIGYIIDNGCNLTEDEEEWLERYSYKQAVKLAKKLNYKL